MIGVEGWTFLTGSSTSTSMLGYCGVTHLFVCFLSWYHAAVLNVSIPFPLSVFLALVGGLRFEPHRCRCVSRALILSLWTSLERSLRSAPSWSDISRVLSISRPTSSQTETSSLLAANASVARKCCFNGRDIITGRVPSQTRCWCSLIIVVFDDVQGLPERSLPVAKGAP